MDPHPTHDSYSPSEPTTQTASLSVQPSLHRRRVSLYFTMGRPFSPRNLPLPMGGAGPPSNTWFPGPTQVLNPIGSSIGAAVFAGLTSVTDRHTDRPTDRPTDHATRSVRIGRIYVRSTAMRPNNVEIMAVVVYSKFYQLEFFYTALFGQMSTSLHEHTSSASNQ